MDSNACAEIDFILSNLSPSDLSKIPEDYIQLFKQNKSKTYVVSLNKDKPLREQKLLYTTQVYLAVIYRSFFATEDEKKEYKEKYKQEIINEQNKISKFSSDNLFDSKKKRNITTDKTPNLIPAKRKNIFIRFIEFLGGKK